MPLLTQRLSAGFRRLRNPAHEYLPSLQGLGE